MMPDNANAKLFNALQGLGKGFAQTGSLNPDLLKTVAGTERYAPIFVSLFKLLSRLPLLSMYWDSQLKENGVYEQRFAQPYADPPAEFASR
jgi:hypothetical protein